MKKSCTHASNPTVEQQANLRGAWKKLESSCCLADETDASEIEYVLHDEDVASIALGHDSDHDLSSSINDASMVCSNENSMDSDSMDCKDNNTYGRPYVPFSVEEVSLVKSLSLWSNHNVRIVGNISRTEDFDVWCLVSIGEEGGPFSILVDMRLVSFPHEGCPVQVFGEIQIADNAPRILVKFFRDFSSVDIFYHNKGVEELKKFIPHFIGKRNSQSRMLDDSE